MLVSCDPSPCIGTIVAPRSRGLTHQDEIWLLAIRSEGVELLVLEQVMFSGQGRACCCSTRPLLASRRRLDWVRGWIISAKSGVDEWAGSRRTVCDEGAISVTAFIREGHFLPD